MDAAWQQIGDVLEANRRIRAAQLAKLDGRHAGTTRHLPPLLASRPERALALTAPVQRACGRRRVHGRATAARRASSRRR